jgi:hypothetical protein
VFAGILEAEASIASEGRLPCEFALSKDTSPSNFCSRRAVCDECLGVALFFRTEDDGLQSFFRRKHLTRTTQYTLQLKLERGHTSHKSLRHSEGYIYILRAHNWRMRGHMALA